MDEDDRNDSVLVVMKLVELVARPPNEGQHMTEHGFSSINYELF